MGVRGHERQGNIRQQTVQFADRAFGWLSPRLHEGVALLILMMIRLARLSGLGSACVKSQEGECVNSFWRPS
jgi:hypothetical protein